MNVLRELRKFKTKSALAKIRILILLAAMLATSTYAWFYTEKKISMTGFKSIVVDWDVEYSIDGDEIEEEEIVIAVDEFYPEMEEFTKVIKTRNLTRTGAEIKYEVTSVRLFGIEIFDQLIETNNITTEDSTTNVFSTEDYPFKVGYYYDKTILSGIGPSTPEHSPETYGTLTIFAKWDGTDNEGDTAFGQDTYEYYKNDPLSETYSPLEVTIKITSGRVGGVP